MSDDTTTVMQMFYLRCLISTGFFKKQSMNYVHNFI